MRKPESPSGFTTNDVLIEMKQILNEIKKVKKAKGKSAAELRNMSAKELKAYKAEMKAKMAAKVDTEVKKQVKDIPKHIEKHAKAATEKTTKEIMMNREKEANAKAKEQEQSKLDSLLKIRGPLSATLKDHVPPLYRQAFHDHIRDNEHLHDEIKAGRGKDLAIAFLHAHRKQASGFNPKTGISLAGKFRPGQK